MDMKRAWMIKLRGWAAWAGLAAMALGPLWGYLAMGLRRLLRGGALADTLTFYLMVAGWLVMPVGVLLLLYRLTVRAIIRQRRNDAIR